MLTKNEADIVGHCLAAASQWADHIYVYDHMSSDGTWDVVRSMENDKITPWKRHNKPFNEGLRADVFNEFRSMAEEGDWWLRLDADEFYCYDPKDKLSKIKERCAFIWGVEIQYFLTDKDVSQLDFSLPTAQIIPALRYYQIRNSEPRWFRHRPGLVWQSQWAWPRHVGLTLRDRLAFKHYQYRSPAQIQKRLDARREARARGFPGFHHASEESWKEKIVPYDRCRYDDGVEPLTFDDAALPKHIEPFLRRLPKRALHALRIWP